MVDESDVILAARLVLGPRATQLPADPDEEEAPPPPPPPPPEQESEANEPEEGELTGPLEDMVLAAVTAAMPAGLLARLAVANHSRNAGTTGSAGAMVHAKLRDGPPERGEGIPKAARAST